MFYSSWNYWNTAFSEKISREHPHVIFQPWSQYAVAIPARTEQVCSSVHKIFVLFFCIYPLIQGGRVIDPLKVMRWVIFLGNIFSSLFHLFFRTLTPNNRCLEKEKGLQILSRKMAICIDSAVYVKSCKDEFKCHLEILAHLSNFSTYKYVLNV